MVQDWGFPLRHVDGRGAPWWWSLVNNHGLAMLGSPHLAETHIGGNPNTTPAGNRWIPTPQGDITFWGHCKDPHLQEGVGRMREICAFPFWGSQSRTGSPTSLLNGR